MENGRQTAMMSSLMEMTKRRFFKAMLAGWVGGETSPLPVREMPGFKEFVFKEEDFTVIDCFGTHEEKSTGTTTILCGHQVVWFMSYMGHYRKEDIPFLKKVLASSYEKGEFNGGRGPLSSCFGDLVYTNRVSDGSTFSGFRGEETISDHLGIRGCHVYWGAEVAPTS